MNPLYDYVKQKIGNKLNVNIAIIGPTGSGKSLAALRLACDLDSGFPLDASRVVFSTKDFYLLVQQRVENIILPGSAIVLDEASVDLSSGKHYMDESIQNMRQILHTFRKFRLITILTFPISMGKISSQLRDAFDIIIDMRGINFQEKYSTGVPHLVQINSYSGKDYRHQFKDLAEDGEQFSMSALKIYLPPQPLVDAYDSRQDAFKRKLLRDAIKFEEKEAVQIKAKALTLKDYYDQVVKRPKDFLNAKENCFSYASIMVHLGLKEKQARALTNALNTDWSNGKISIKQ